MLFLLLATVGVALLLARPVARAVGESAVSPTGYTASRVPGAWLKPGVDDSRLRPEAVAAVEAAVQAVRADSSLGPVVVTSTYEGQHLPNSLHYKDLAVDLRSNHLADAPTRARYRDAIRARLPRGYDVLSEGPGGASGGYDRDFSAPHIHAEFDPHGVSGVG